MPDADRTVRVRLEALVSGYNAAMARAGQSTRQLATEIGKAEKAHKQGFDTMVRGSAIAGGALVAGFGMAVKSAMDFDKQMSAVAAAGDEYNRSLTALRETALEAGKATKFSATEAAAGEEALAKAGVSAADIIGGGLTGALNLAASGNLDVAGSAEVAASAMTQFGLAGQDVSHIADLLAAGAGKAQGEVSDLGMALRMSGQVSATMGQTLEDAVGALAEFAAAGLTGSDAGTSFKQMLLSLTPQSEKAAEAMDAYGLSFFDANGRARHFSDIAGELHDKLGGLSQEQQTVALKTIFGADAFRVAAIAMRDGAAGAEAWRNKVSDAGYASDQAARKMDNLAGDVEQLRGSLETAFISGGSGATAGLRSLTQTATGAVNAFLEMPPALQQGVVMMSGFGGATLLALSGVGFLVPKVQAARVALASMGTAGVRANTVLGTVGRTAGRAAAGFVALEAAGLAVSAIQDAVVDAAPKVNALTESLLDLQAGAAAPTGALLDAFGQDLSDFGADLERIVDPSVLHRIDDWGLKITHVFGEARTLREAKERFTALDAALAGLVQSGHTDIAAQRFQHFAAVAALSGRSVADLERVLPDYTEAVAGAGNESRLAAGGLTDFGTSAEDAAEKAKALDDAIKTLEGTFTARDAARAYEQSLDDLAKSLRENGRSMDINTQAGRDNQKALDAVAEKALAVRDHWIKQGLTVEEVSRNYGNYIGRLRGVLAQLGYTTPQIDALTAALVLADQTEAKPKVSVPGAKPATTEVQRLDQKIRQIKDKIARLKLEGTVTAALQAQRLIDKLRQLQSKRIYISAHMTLDGSGYVLLGGSALAWEAKAQGGISHPSIYAAAAGVSPREASLMRSAGSPLYQWREAGGEAFIPLEPAKRARSRRIAEQTVGILGGQASWSDVSSSLPMRGTVGGSWSGGSSGGDLGRQVSRLLRVLPGIAGDVTVNNPLPEPASESVASVLRRRQWAMTP